ncbi:hypothetical protein D9611_013536 [Ephemerocybe angulata]|uniref:P-loop containing nucleoside triphosphate hydrolase protein n=1 Tax=Ephemerocybe angulata TaxID=980116 RepID=A0A8H5C438_9AGAR|nr:hypothetical protein D9611_013536 [Tulosesus angulatus]
MDFDDFDERPQDVAETTKNASGGIEGILRAFDKAWYVGRGRASRRMDLLGDYAGNELFLIDGESLFQAVLDDPLLALGRENDCSFQILHAYHTLERILSEYTTRSTNFEIVFFYENRHLTLRTGDDPFVVASRTLARTLLFKHILKLNLPVNSFRSLVDHRWKDYENEKKPMFILMNDGDFPDFQNPMSAHRVLAQRKFVSDLLGGSIAMALLKGAEYADSKIITFVYEPVRQGAGSIFPPLFLRALATVQKDLETILQEVMPKEADLLCSHLRDHDATVDIENAQDEFITLISKRLLSMEVPKSAQPILASLTFVNIVHFLQLPTLTVQDRSQPSISIKASASQNICKAFLAPLFFEATRLLATAPYRNLPYDFDGRVFLTSLVYLSQESSLDTKVLLGETLASRVSRIWGAARGEGNLTPTLVELPAVAPWLGRPTLPGAVQGPSAGQEPAEPLQLLPFTNSVLNKHLPSVSRPSSDLPNTPASPQDGQAAFMQFGREGTMFSDTKHWHNQKSILPPHLGGDVKEQGVTPWVASRRLRKQQQFMFNLQMQAATITGATGSALKQVVIPPAGSNAKVTKGTPALEKKPVVKPPPKSIKKDKPVKLSSKQLLLQKIQDQKLAEANDNSKVWWKEKLLVLEGMKLEARVQELGNLLRNKRSDEEMLKLEMELYQLHLEVQRWVQDSAPSSSETRDKYSLSIMRLIKKMLDRKVVTAASKEAITTILILFGFERYLEGLFDGVRILDGASPSFKFVKLMKTRAGKPTPVHEFIAIKEGPIEWQLRMFGEYMDRSMDSAYDRRVPFHPDAWQRRVLDCIDANHSMLVVAPTSAGKTFISFYAMEQILRSSDDDILVYVAPTKALVTQIAAEIYARFSKKLDSKTCWAIHTRDYRINDPQKCQILVTVPEVLSIMLLSPPLATVWTPKIKRIVLDEIHSIGHQEGGSVWEQILLLAPCPIIGLSATIGSPKIFNDWLEAVQTAHGFKHTFINHPHRYSHLRKFYYVLDDAPPEFTSLSSHEVTGRVRFVHPVSALAFGNATLPDDLSMEARDTLSLYRALVDVFGRGKGGMDKGELERLDPNVFFAGRKDLLRQKDILEYEAVLKHAVAGLLAGALGGEPQSDTKALPSSENLAFEVISRLQDPMLKKLGSKLDVIPERGLFMENLIHMLADLHAKNELPAILFNYDRSGCEIIGKAIREFLDDAETRYKQTSPSWQRKLAQWEVWKAGAKERERQAAERQKKRRPGKGDGDEAPDPGASSGTATWEQSFDPNQPLADFSFVDQKSSYAMSELDQDIQKLRWGGKVPEWAFDLLRRGIGVHHSGMNKGYRSLVEALFRRGFLRVVVATGTLALGINAPAKTTVFCGDSPYLTALEYRQCAGRAGRRGFDLLGNVIFYGFPMDRVQRLMVSKLPLLGGGFPVTSTLVLRLCNLLEESNHAPNVVKAIDALMSLPRVSFSSDVGRDYLVHHIQFSIEYLRRNGLLNEEGKPMNLFAVAGHLYYTEPSNLALVGLLRAGILHGICKGIQANTDLEDIRVEEAKRVYILLMAHLFGRKILPSSLSENEAELKGLTSKYPSKVVLPPMPEVARISLERQAKDILQVFVGYAKAFATSKSQTSSGNETLATLPLSGAWAPQDRDDDTDVECPKLTAFLRQASTRTTIRSPFVANSGLQDGDFTTVQELADTVRTDIHLNAHAIPCFDGILASAATLTRDRGTKTGNPRLKTPPPKLNGYLYDFYIHGQAKTIVNANGIRSGDLWYLFEDFRLTLLTVKSALEQLLVKASVEALSARNAKNKKPMKAKKRRVKGDWDDESSDDDSDDGIIGSALDTDTVVQSELGSQDETLLNTDLGEGTEAETFDDEMPGAQEDFKRPTGVADADWAVYRVVSSACKEFDLKARDMWA